MATTKQKEQNETGPPLNAALSGSWPAAPSAAAMNSPGLRNLSFLRQRSSRCGRGPSALLSARRPGAQRAMRSKVPRPGPVRGPNLTRSGAKRARLSSLLLCFFLPAAAVGQGLPRPPVITTQPQSQFVGEGETATLSVGTLRSILQTRYQWQQYSTDLTSATQAVLSLPVIHSTNAGAYTVKVSNGSGTRVSDPATVAVLTVLSNQSVSLGAAARFLARIDPGPTNQILQWQYNGQDLPGATNASLSLTNIQVADAGEYAVVAQTELGTARAAAQLEVDPTFTKITTGQIVNDGGISSYGCSWGDYNNDGFLDIFIGRNGTEASTLFRNNRDGTFTKITNGILSSVSQTDGTWGGVWADFDNDGFLDLFLARCCGDRPNRLLHNLGDGAFEVVNPQNQFGGFGDFPSAGWADYDHDGLVDLLVANDGGANNLLYRNLGNGGFTRTSTIGTVFRRGTGIAWGDYNNDGVIDLFMANASGSFDSLPSGIGDARNLLYRGNGDGTFMQILEGSIVTNVATSVSAIAARGRRSRRKRPINSAAMCWASAALPPLPKRRIL